MKLRMTVNGHEYEVVVEKNGGDYRVDIGDHVYKCLFKDDKVMVNGEVAPVKASPHMRELADTRELACSQALLNALTKKEKATLRDWIAWGWLHYQED